MTEHFTKSPGQYVPMNETVDSVIRIVNGEYIKQSPEIFAFVGSALNIKTDKELGTLRTNWGAKYMKRDKIKKLSVLTFSSLSVVSTFAIISASCEPIEKVDAPQVVGIESSAPLSNSDVTKPRLLL